MGRRHKAKVAELVDALALGASGVTRESSSLSFRTNTESDFNLNLNVFFHRGPDVTTDITKERETTRKSA